MPWWSCTQAIPFSYAIGYCFGLSILFVASLYVLVPYSVRQLDRDDPRQIQWRSLATITVGVVACWSYPFCESVSRYRILESLRLEFLATIAVALHTCVLFTGSMIQQWIIDSSTERRSIVARIRAFLWPTHRVLLWIRLRQWLVAPITEELSFRCCMVPAMSQSGLTSTTVIWTTPLWFGVCHAHHAWLKLIQPNRCLRTILLQTIFQMAYTTIFGVYVSWVYLNTRSVLAVIVCHSICNCWGVPDLSILAARPVVVGHVVGILGFTAGFYAKG